MYVHINQKSKIPEVQLRLHAIRTEMYFSLLQVGVQKIVANTWNIFQPLLFGLVGTEVSVEALESRTIGKSTKSTGDGQHRFYFVYTISPSVFKELRNHTDHIYSFPLPLYVSLFSVKDSPSDPEKQITGNIRYHQMLLSASLETCPQKGNSQLNEFHSNCITSNELNATSSAFLPVVLPPSHNLVLQKNFQKGRGDGLRGKLLVM